MSPATQRSPFRLLPLLFIAACGGGSDDGGGDSTPAPASPSGSWNFFREGTSCEGDEFVASSLTIDDLGGGAFEVRLGDAPEEFVFTAQRSGDQLDVSGTAIAGDTTLEIVDAQWLLAGDANSLTGTMTTLRTVGSQPACEFVDAVEGFRQDATEASVVRGGWDWSAITVDSTGGCNEVGSLEVLTVFVLPKRQDQFVVDLTTGDGGRLQFDASLDGDTLILTGEDDLPSGSARLLPGSNLAFDAEGGFGQGTLFVESTESGGSCSFDLDISATRSRAGRDFIPFISDAEGTANLMGVDPEAPDAPFDFEARMTELGSEGSLDVDQIDAQIEVVESPLLDLESGLITGHVRSSMYFVGRSDTEDSLLHQDIAVRLDAFGNPIDLPSTTIPFSSAPVRITNIAVLTDFDPNEEVLLVTTRDPLSLEEEGFDFVVARDRFGFVRSTRIPGIGDRVVGPILDQDGRVDEVLVLGQSGILYRQNFNGTSTTVDTNVSQAKVSPDGFAVFVKDDELRILERNQAASTLLASGNGGDWTLGEFEGRTLYAARMTGSLLTLRRYDRSNPNATVVIGTVDVFTGAAAQGNVFLATQVRATEDHVLVRIESPGTTTSWFSIEEESGATFRVQSGLFGTSSVDTDRTAGNWHFSDQSNSLTVAIDASGNAATGFADGGSILGSVDADQYPRSGARRTESLVLSSESGALRVLDDAGAPFGGLPAATTRFSSPGPGRRLTVGVHPSGFLVADRTSSSAAIAEGRMNYLGREEGASPILVLDIPGELALPVR